MRESDWFHLGLGCFNFILFGIIPTAFIRWKYKYPIDWTEPEMPLPNGDKDLHLSLGEIDD